MPRTAILLALAATCCLHADAVARRPMPKPPWILMYGFGDAGLPLWSETLNRANIITGQTTDAQLVRSLKQRGIMFAYHVNAASEPGRETPEELADYWCKALENTLGGKLAEGFDAIAVDEIGSPDGSPESKRICRAMRLTRERCPDRRIFMWGGWRMAEGGGGSYYIPAGENYDDELRATFEDGDLLLFEEYIHEANPQFDLFGPHAKNLASRIPGMLTKTLFTLYISQNDPFVADDSDAADFKGFLDEQFHLLRTDPYLKQTPGTGFWPFYRARADTIAQVNELVRHYYQEGRTDYYGSGSWKQLVQNPGFETDSGWDLRPGPGGSASTAAYADFPGVPDKHGVVAHGKRCLRFVRGAQPNEARQPLCLRPSTWYTLSAYCYSPQPGSALLRALDAAGHPLQGQRGHTHWGPWTSLLLTFRTDPTGAATLLLSDRPLSPGQISYWDFVEVEQCRGMNRPTTIRASEYDRQAGCVTLRGENLMPGSTLSMAGGPAVRINWQSPQSAWVEVPSSAAKLAGPDSRTDRAVLRKPAWCLHPHKVTWRLP